MAWLPRLVSLAQRVLTYCVLSVVATLCLGPALWILISSFKTRASIFQPRVWFTPTLANYAEVLFQDNFLRFFCNSLVVCMLTVVVTLVLATPAAYGFSRFDFRRKGDLMFFCLSTRMAPPAAFVLPFFVIFCRLGLVDKLGTLVVVYAFFNTAFCIWLLKGFFDEIPREIDDSARVDGCTRLGVFSAVALPLSRVGVAIGAVFTFMFSWNEYLFALVLTRSSAKTLPVFVPQYMGVTFLRYEVMCAAASLALVPVLVFAMMAQRHFIRGLTLGAVKE